MRRIYWGKTALAGAIIFVAGVLHAAVLSPIEVTGWDQDVVLGIGEDYDAGTTAQFDGGEGKTVYYQKGYNGSAPTTGLSTGLIESETTADLFFQLQSFTANNALWHGGTLTLSTATAFEQIALIGATGNGSANLTITLNYTTGGADIFNTGNAGVGQDWFNGNSVACIASGRISTVSGSYEYVGDSNPRLYETILTADSTRLLQSIQISDAASYTDGGNAIMAISGERTYVAPEPSSIALMTSALCLLFSLRRFRFIDKKHLSGK